MKYLSTAAILLFSIGFGWSQSSYDDLLELIVDEKYERCLFKAVRYTESEKTTNEPLPYVYMSMAYFRIGQTDDPTLKDKYPKASKEAIKYLVKFIKKDKNSEFIAEFADYISEVRVSIIAEAEQESDNEKYTRSKGLYKYLTDIDNNDPGAWMMRGHSEFMMKSKKDSQNSWNEAKRIVEEGGVPSLRKEQVQLFKMGVIRTAEMLFETGDREQAKAWMRITEPFFKDDKEYKVTYSSIM